MTQECWKNYVFNIFKLLNKILILKIHPNGNFDRYTYYLKDSGHKLGFLSCVSPNPSFHHYYCFLFALKTCINMSVHSSSSSEDWCPFTFLNTSLFWAQVAHSNRNDIYLYPHYNANLQSDVMRASFCYSKKW